MATDVNTSDNKPSPSGKTPPCHKIRLAATKCSVWKRDISAQTTPLYTATFTRLYVDAHGNWAESTSFGRDDLLVLAKVADAAHTWMCEQQQRDRRGQDSSVPF